MLHKGGKEWQAQHKKKSSDESKKKAKKIKKNSFQSNQIMKRLIIK